MKRLVISLAVFVALMINRSAALAAADPGALAAGVRLHRAHSVFTALPFGDDDWSYQLAYEYHENNSFWQLAVGYAPDVTGSNGVDYVLTPQINLLLQQGAWHEGLGVLGSYIKPSDSGDSEWSSVYWQLILGFEIPVAGVNIGADAYYKFEDWRELDEFDFDDVEFGGWISYRF